MSNFTPLIAREVPKYPLYIKFIVRDGDNVSDSDIILNIREEQIQQKRTERLLITT